MHSLAMVFSHYSKRFVFVVPSVRVLRTRSKPIKISIVFSSLPICCGLINLYYDSNQMCTTLVHYVFICVFFFVSDKYRHDLRNILLVRLDSHFDMLGSSLHHPRNMSFPHGGKCTRVLFTYFDGPSV